VAEERID